MKQRLRIGTRTSRLALEQSRQVAAQLAEAIPGLSSELVHFSTQGDRSLDQPLPAIGGKGLFTHELELALLRGDIDVAVHSLKDLPITCTESLTIGAVLARADARDCLVAKNGWTLDTLPQGAVVGTSSPRRQAQLLAYRGDFHVVAVRGNVETRIRRALEEDCHAVVLAAAGLHRLDLTGLATQVIPFEIMLPAPGQGALAVQCRAGDSHILAWLEQIDDPVTRAATGAERSFLERLGGGCSAPVGALAERLPGGSYALRVFAAADGAQPFRADVSGTNVLELSHALAQQALEHFGTSGKPAGTRQASSGLPLNGKRIVVTRPKHQAAELARALEEMGATVLVAPSVKVEPLEDSPELRDALSRLAGYRWVVFTSANAVSCFASELARAGMEPAALAADTIAAVGPSTEAELRSFGFRCDFVPASYTGADLAATLPVEPSDRVLLPRAAAAGDDLPAILDRRGAVVDDVPLYRTVPIALDAVILAQLESGVDMVTFTSGSAVRSFVESVRQRPELANLLRQCKIACIGPRTADAVREAGYVAEVVAASHTMDDLVDAIVDYYRPAA